MLAVFYQSFKIPPCVADKGSQHPREDKRNTDGKKNEGGSTLHLVDEDKCNSRIFSNPFSIKWINQPPLPSAS